MRDCNGATPSVLLTRERVYPSYWIPMSRGSQTNAPNFASSELLETLRERAYVRGRRDSFLITEELALLATDLVAAFEPSRAAVGWGADHRAVWDV